MIRQTDRAHSMSVAIDSPCSSQKSSQSPYRRGKSSQLVDVLCDDQAAASFSSCVAGLLRHELVRLYRKWVSRVL